MPPLENDPGLSWYDNAMRELRRQVNEGEITYEEFQQKKAELDARAQDERNQQIEDVWEAGTGQQADFGSSRSQEQAIADYTKNQKQSQLLGGIGGFLASGNKGYAPVQTPTAPAMGSGVSGSSPSGSMSLLAASGPTRPEVEPLGKRGKGITDLLMRKYGGGWL